VELSVLSALVHGNGPNGFGVVKAALLALNDLDREHAMVYFQIIDNVLREPVRRALEVLFMDNQGARPRIYSPTAVKLFTMGQVEGLREGQLQGLREGQLQGLREGQLQGLREGQLQGLREGQLQGLREGQLQGLREALVRLIARAGFTLLDEERARIEACSEPETLERWIENVLGAKNTADVFG
jgi:hypothetical protein